MTMPLIGLAGRPGAGKRTVARILCEVQAFVQIPDRGRWLDRRQVQDDLIRLRDTAERMHIDGVVIARIDNDNHAHWLRGLGGSVWHIIGRGRLLPLWRLTDPGRPASGITPQPGDRTLPNTDSLDHLAAWIDFLLHGDAHAKQR